MVDDSLGPPWSRNAWLRPLVAVLSAVLVLFAFRWAFFDQRSGTTLQLVLQVLVPVPVVIGLAVCLARVREGRLWLVAALGFAAAIPALLLAWVDPPQGPDGGCSARGFLPMAVADALEGYGMWGMPLVAVACLVGGLGLACWRPARPVGLWLAIAGIAQAAAMFTSWTCIGE